MTRSEWDANLGLARAGRDDRWMRPAPVRAARRGWFARVILAILGC